MTRRLCIRRRAIPFQGPSARHPHVRTRAGRARHPTRLRAALGDRYLIEEEIGRGGAATVYLAEDVKHARQSGDQGAPARTRRGGYEPQRFLREIRIAARLAHPQILPLHDSGECDGLLYFVMPYAGCESCATGSTARAAAVDVALRITRAVADALAYAHRLNVIHRDIKPENILLQEGEPVVADFGVATAISAAAGDSVVITDHGFTVGTPAYMSPEQASAESGLDGRTDQYSLACVLYEMLAGEPPFAGTGARATMARHAIEPPPSIRALPAHGAGGGRARARARAGQVARRPLPGMTEFVAALVDPDADLPGGGLHRRRRAGDRRAAVRQRQRRPRERILQRRDDRGADHGAHQGGGAERGLAHLGVRPQGGARGCPRPSAPGST